MGECIKITFQPVAPRRKSFLRRIYERTKLIVKQRATEVVRKYNLNANSLAQRANALLAYVNARLSAHNIVLTNAMIGKASAETLNILKTHDLFAKKGKYTRA